ncbi:hypothetical protein SNEBB_005772 [Seison nebaliae]|nr:hypothetical protein SNEBB_005772 [Seison nebaliae]
MFNPSQNCIPLPPTSPPASTSGIAPMENNAAWENAQAALEKMNPNMNMNNNNNLVNMSGFGYSNGMTPHHPFPSTIPSSGMRSNVDHQTGGSFYNQTNMSHDSYSNHGSCPYPSNNDTFTYQRQNYPSQPYSNSQSPFSSSSSSMAAPLLPQQPNYPANEFYKIPPQHLSVPNNSSSRPPLLPTVNKNLEKQQISERARSMIVRPKIPSSVQNKPNVNEVFQTTNIPPLMDSNLILIKPTIITMEKQNIDNKVVLKTHLWPQAMKVYFTKIFDQKQSKQDPILIKNWSKIFIRRMFHEQLVYKLNWDKLPFLSMVEIRNELEQINEDEDKSNPSYKRKSDDDDDEEKMEGSENSLQPSKNKLLRPIVGEKRVGGEQTKNGLTDNEIRERSSLIVELKKLRAEKRVMVDKKELRNLSKIIIEMQKRVDEINSKVIYKNNNSQLTTISNNFNSSILTTTTVANSEESPMKSLATTLTISSTGKSTSSLSFVDSTTKKKIDEELDGEVEPHLSEERRQKRFERFNQNYTTSVAKKSSWKKDVEYDVPMTDENDCIKGTCTNLEKSYFRLTSAPAANTVRPPYILKKSLEMVMAKWRNAENKSDVYEYVNEQLKSIRQDLTIQNIRSDLTIRAYESHGRISLVMGDRGQFNQCQTQLKSLYHSTSSDVTWNGRRYYAEFFAYSIIYQMFSKNPSSLSMQLSELFLDNNDDNDVDDGSNIVDNYNDKLSNVNETTRTNECSSDSQMRRMLRTKANKQFVVKWVKDLVRDYHSENMNRFFNHYRFSLTKRLNVSNKFNSLSDELKEEEQSDSLYLVEKVLDMFMEHERVLFFKKICRSYAVKTLPLHHVEQLFAFSSTDECFEKLTKMNTVFIIEDGINQIDVKSTYKKLLENQV